MIAPEQWKGKCLVCKEEFSYPDFACKKLPGNHRVEAKTYFHMGGGHIQNERDRRGWAPLVILNAPGDRMDPSSGKMTPVQPVEAQFQAGGQFTTQDAQQQFYLETRAQSVGWGEAGKKQWQGIYLTPGQRQQLTQAELNETERKLKETNALLAQTQERVKSRDRAGA